MNPLLILVAATAIGVEAGWEPLPEGGHRYTIQIEPELVRRLESGEDLVSEVPPQIDVRSFRITLGSGALARIDGPPSPQATAQTEPPSEPAPNDALAAPDGPAIDAAADNTAAVPASFDGAAADAQPLAATPPERAAEPQLHSAEKPELKAQPGANGSAPLDEPWIPLLVAVGFLAASLGANLYLGWVAWDARSRYRSAVARLRNTATA